MKARGSPNWPPIAWALRTWAVFVTVTENELADGSFGEGVAQYVITAPA